MLFIDLKRLAFDEKRTRLDEIYGDEKSYFTRLSILDVKRWLLMEKYNRVVLKIKGIDDESYEKLNTVKGHSQRYSNEPPNFLILSNLSYCEKIRYNPVHDRMSEHQIETSDKIATLLMGC
jgi:hypothetical protein